MVDTRSNIKLSDLKSKPMVEKASDISLTVPLKPVSTLLKGQNSRNSFNLTNLMDPLISITTTRITTRRIE